MITRIKNAHTIVTCDDFDSILHNTDILIEDGRIRGLGPSGGPADESIDGTQLIVYPGLINTHHHLYQYFTRNLRQVQGLELFDWLTALYGIWRHINEDSVRLSSLCGMGELMKYGCTTCLDHHYVFPKDAGSRLIDAQFDAAAQLGIRMHACRGSMSLSQKDGGLPPDSVVQDVDEILFDSERLIARYHDPAPFSMRQIVLAPCSPFSVTAELMRESARLARKHGVRLHTHLCETRDEESFTRKAHGMRPLAYMQSLDFIGPDVFYAHGIHFDDAELKLLADTQSGVSHNPCSNMKLSSGVCRVPDMLRLGIPLGLAVDGSASNDGSNLLSEIRAAYLIHRHAWGEKAPTGYDLLKIATRGSARLLGREDIGQLAADKAADLFCLRANDPALVCANLDPANMLGTVGYHKPAAYVFVNGKMTVKDGRLLGLDETELYHRSDAETRCLLRL